MTPWTTRWRAGRLHWWLGAALAIAGCERAVPERARAPSLLEARMRPAIFASPAIGAPLPYRLFVPPGLPGVAPLIVWLHATGGRGKDNLRQLGPELEVLVSDRVQAAGPAFVLAPQCPEGEKWANQGASFPLRPYDLAAAPEGAAARATVALVADLVGRYPVDPHRIYLMGFSMGARAPGTC